jgi:hypothetical protein
VDLWSKLDAFDAGADEDDRDHEDEVLVLKAADGRIDARGCAAYFCVTLPSSQGPDSSCG